ncbi:unnamed protein product [Adineta steineri]|uniref:Uncharacterized protein n=1 Tax=Adineta steineri TaxID=433720 RepID=A0A818Q331_9BILA|nr:unnamed protein product [Adineta steineri]CAF1393397.1 unnamed protein product [Adineta steineri]CAF3633947.1 unnamed protein product [Adineta steineri]CAF3769404.1 unnamed protein product [Adineta steineri]
MQLFIIIILVISFGFAFIGITTNYWYQSPSNEFNEGLWVICRLHASTAHSSTISEVCDKIPYFKSQGLAITGIIFLSISIILSTIQRYKKTDRLLAYLTITTLTLDTLLLILSCLLFPREMNIRRLGYSLSFVLCSSLLSFLTIGLVAFNARTSQSI